MQFIGFAIGSQPNQAFTVTYTDGTTTAVQQSVSDWGSYQGYAGEAVALTTAYRDTSTGAPQNGPYDLYGYSIALDSTKTVKSLTLPNNSNVILLGVNLLAVGANPFNPSATATGVVTAVTDPVRGNVATVAQQLGSLTYSSIGTTFNGSYTKMAWFQPNGSGYIDNLVSAINPGQAHFLAAVNSGNSVQVTAGQSDGKSIQINLLANSASTVGTWMNIALVYDATVNKMTAYVNGTLLASQTNVAVAPSAIGILAALNMGSYGQSVGSGLDGKFAGNRAWNVALTAAQIASIYNYELASRAGF